MSQGPARDAQPSLTGLYEILLELGRGGMGTVHLARALGQAGFERLVVLKRMHAHLLTEPRSVRRFVDEARIAAQLHHANIVGIQQVGADDGGYFLVLDYVEGDSIDGLLRRAAAAGERIPPRVIARALLDGLAGLAAAHEATDGAGQSLEILHRDVSIQNLLVGRDGITRLTDFGIARDARAAGATAPGRLVGKPLYMSPEYLRGEPIDVRVDVYGMGVTSWVAFAGGEPWPDASDAQLVLLTMQKGIPDLRERHPDVPVEIASVVTRAIDHAAAKRFGSARAMADALANAAEISVGLATQDEVAALVQKLAGAELAQRRKRVASLGASNGETKGTVVRAKRPAPPPSREETPAGAMTRESSEGRLRAAMISTSEEGTTRASRSGLAVATPNVTGQPSLDVVAPEEDAAIAGVSSRRSWLPIGAAALAVLAIGGVVLARRSEPDTTSPGAAASPSASAATSPSAPPPYPQPSASVSTEPAPTASARPPRTAPPRPPVEPPRTARPPDGISTSNPYLR